MNLLQQLDAFMQTHELSKQHNQLLENAICALNAASLVIQELEIADQIIHNCISNMTDEQRLQTAIDNHLDHLPAQWAFRSSERKELIANAQKMIGVAFLKGDNH